MQQYRYTAVNLQKQKFTGTFIAKDEKDLAVQLAKQNLFLVSSAPYTGKTPSAFFTTGTGKVKMQELTLFCNQFSIMLTAGIPVLEVLEALKAQPFSTYFKSILAVIYDDVKSGIMLSKAIDKHKKVFPDFFCSMIHVGEASGNLEQVFKALSNYYEKDANIKRKVKSAFSYPIMLGIMTVGIVILMLLFIVPTFKDTLSGLDVKPNGLTSFIFGFSEFLINDWMYVLLGMVVIVGGVVGFAKSKVGKYYIDLFKFKIPGINKIEIDTTTARFCRGFSLLISSGMDIVKALNAISVVIGNQCLLEKFNKATEEVKHGTSLSKAFEKYAFFPQLMVQMISVGERTATLNQVLNDSCDYFDDEVDNTLASVTAKIQPIMLIVMGLVIGSMFIAVYSPMISIMTEML